MDFLRGFLNLGYGKDIISMVQHLAYQPLPTLGLITTEAGLVNIKKLYWFSVSRKFASMYPFTASLLLELSGLF